MWRQEEWEKMRQKIIDLQADIALFNAEFFERDRFKRFANDLFKHIGSRDEVCITGYFSEAIRKQLERVIKISPPRRVRMICPHFPIRSARDRKNLKALVKINKAGAEIRVNDRLHARFLVSYSPWRREDKTVLMGLLLIGSFDFNTECIGMERYDAGIKTLHPDLITSAVKLFEEIWRESTPLLENYENELKKMKI